MSAHALGQERLPRRDRDRTSGLQRADQVNSAGFQRRPVFISDRRADHEKVGFDRGNRVVEFEIGIASVDGGGFRIERAAFEYQVKCLYGYISSNRIQRS